jgi:hypothetical protein
LPDDAYLRRRRFTRAGPSVAGRDEVVPWAAVRSGSHWTTTALQSTLGNTEGDLQSVSCPTTTTCEAVGTANPIAGEYDTSGLTEQLKNGTWTTGDVAPNAVNTSIPGVDCFSTVALCAAVGTADNSPLIVWLLGDGNYTGPSITDPTYSDLYGVTCVGAHSCFAIASGVVVGITANNAKTVAKVTAPGAASAGLGAISCPKPTVCTVVGGEESASGSFATAGTITSP